MMVLLLGNDPRDGSDRGLVFARQYMKLLLEMAENDALNGDSGGCDGTAAEQGGEDAESEATSCTQPVAAAAGKIAALELGPEDGAMLLLV